ncbi:response regulator transcription factor [Alkalicoccus daliensis]|uniref:Two-component system, OmpR family, alkaline phosphatase synthesis response regulator PhoP n=1 Tax=Alkalicoccus daliensis TaxID=745820 RepID=A0A1H0CPM5_9BACI|nr:response regulator transcription factor [Alkalicoccus daliensis]SDN59814.1 two-component system, OmpR family, alkaline phosphatase synthesis response regulator PhoP [Alkalicoccus daliensis]
MSEQTILIVEKEASLQKEIEHAFQQAGFRSWKTSLQEEAMNMIQQMKPAGVVIGSELKDGSGLDLCRAIRQAKNWTPLVMVTEAANEIDCVLSLELGADDYVTKPLRLKELVARMKAVLRRGSLCCGTEVERTEPGILRNGELKINSEQFAVSFRGEWIDVTRKEFELLVFFANHLDQSFSREELLEAISTEEQGMDKRIIDVFVSRIRQKIEPNKQHPNYIKTVRGVGYMMRSQTSSIAR